MSGLLVSSLRLGFAIVEKLEETDLPHMLHKNCYEQLCSENMPFHNSEILPGSLMWYGINVS